MNVPLTHRKAFTLIELLIVVAIIGILAVALVPRLFGQQGRARDAARQADLNQLQTALELYADDNGGLYPSESGGACVHKDLVTELGPYMASIPQDPLAGNGWAPGMAGLPCSPDGGYTYISYTGATSYILIARLENTNTTVQGSFQDGFTFTLIEDFGTDITNNVELACGGDPGCDETTGAIYVVGR